MARRIYRGVPPSRMTLRIWNTPALDLLGISRPALLSAEALLWPRPKKLTPKNFNRRRFLLQSTSARQFAQVERMVWHAPQPR